MSYRFHKLSPKIVMQDFSFGKDAARAGDDLPGFRLPTTEGGYISKPDLAGQPALIAFGSITCPMTASAMPVLKGLHAEFGDRVQFLLLNVREAHPGEHIGQPETFEQKLANAMELKTRYNLEFPVVVDDLDGTLHRILDPKPNAVFVADSDGTIVFRSLWAGDEKGLRRALEAVIEGKEPEHAQSTAMAGPLARGIGYMDAVLEDAGPRAKRELLLAAPPMALLASLARLFGRLDPERRGAAAIASLAGVLALVFAYAWLA